MSKTEIQDADGNDYLTEAWTHPQSHEVTKLIPVPDRYVRIRQQAQAILVLEDGVLTATERLNTLKTKLKKAEKELRGMIHSPQAFLPFKEPARARELAPA